MNTFDNTATYARPPVDEWYVYQDSGRHEGPLTLDVLVHNVANGAIPRMAFAGFAGEGRWRPMMEIPEVAAALHTFEMASKSSAAPTAPAPPSGRVPLPPRVPSSMAPPAPPLGFVTPPRVTQVTQLSPVQAPRAPRTPMVPQAPETPVVELETSADETIPAPSNPPPLVLQSPIPASLPPVPAPFVAAPMPMQQMVPMPIQPMQAPAPVAAPEPLVPTLPVAVVQDKALAALMPVEKKEEKKETLDPRFRFLPFAIFGACAFVATIEVVVGLILG
jgi:hypothetical protein